jgi:hypothetical protein
MAFIVIGVLVGFGIWIGFMIIPLILSSEIFWILAGGALALFVVGSALYMFYLILHDSYHGIKDNVSLLFNDRESFKRKFLPPLMKLVRGIVFVVFPIVLTISIVGGLPILIEYVGSLLE